jgi:hypothetical protein
MEEREIVEKKPLAQVVLYRPPTKYDQFCGFTLETLPWRAGDFGPPYWEQDTIRNREKQGSYESARLGVENNWMRIG